MNKVSPVIVVETSRNEKIGSCSATYAPIKTCPSDCVFLNNGCYAQSGYCDLRTQRMNEAAKEYDLYQIIDDEARKIVLLSGTKPLRLHVSGDCVDNTAAEILAKACDIYASKSGMPIWSYTHNWKRIDRACWGNISVLASCETTQDVDEAMVKGYAASIVSTRFQKIQNEISYIKCPAQQGNKTCIECRICFSDGKLLRGNKAVFFEVHGHKRIARAAIYSRQQLSLTEGKQR